MAGIARGVRSRRGLVSEVVLDLTRERGIAVNLGEIETEVRARFPEHEPFNVAQVIGQLCTSGILVLVFGRPPHGRYAHREHLIKEVPADEPLAAAVSVIESLWVETNAEVPTADVTNAMRALGVRLPDPRNYRLILDALTRPSSRGASAWRAPRLAARSMTTPDGLTRTLWRPAGAPIPDARPMVGQGHAVMEAVREAEETVGRPVSRAELSLWVTLHATKHPAAEYLFRHRCLGRGLEQLSERRTERLAGGRGSWRVVRDRHTVPGGPPERYTLRPTTRVMREAMALEDRLWRFRPTAELDAISAAKHLTERLCLSPMDDLVVLREDVLTAAVRPREYEPGFSDALQLVRSSNEALTRWVKLLPTYGRWRNVTHLDGVRSEIRAAERLQPAARSLDDQRILIVGEAAVASHQDLLPFIVDLRRLLAQDYATDASMRMFYQRARRVPNPAARWEPNPDNGSLIPAEREGMGWMLVDRVDALCEIWDNVAPPRASNLLLVARTLLGHVLRDPAPLRTALGDIPPSRGDARRPLIVALALLGEPVSYEEAMQQPDDEMDTAAYLLSLILCDPDRNRITREVLRVLTGATSAAARRTANEADRLIGSGALLTAIG
jgi:hypothetical protein